MLCPEWRHIGLFFVKRLDTILYVIRFENIRIHPSTRRRIRCGFIFFHFGERIQLKAPGFYVEFAGRKPIREKFRKKLRIRVDGALRKRTAAVVSYF